MSHRLLVLLAALLWSTGGRGHQALRPRRLAARRRPLPGGRAAAPGAGPGRAAPAHRAASLGGGAGLRLHGGALRRSPTSSPPRPTPSSSRTPPRSGCCCSPRRCSASARAAASSGASRSSRLGLGLFFLDQLSPGQLTGNLVALASGVAFALSIMGLRRARARGAGGAGAGQPPGGRPHRAALARRARRRPPLDLGAGGLPRRLPARPRLPLLHRRPARHPGGGGLAPGAARAGPQPGLDLPLRRGAARPVGHGGRRRSSWWPRSGAPCSPGGWSAGGAEDGGACRGARLVHDPPVRERGQPRLSIRGRPRARSSTTSPANGSTTG